MKIQKLGKDVDDPDFWDKVKEQAQLEVVEEVEDENLILDVPRNRRQVTNFDGHDGEDDNDRSADYRPFRPADMRIWTNTERARLERLMMQHGYYQFEKMASNFKRSPEQIQACCRALLLRCLDTCSAVEKETILDVKRALAIFHPVEPRPGLSEEEWSDILLLDEDPQVVYFDDEEPPWPEADEKESAEFDTCISGAPQDYLELLEKKAKNLLIRVALMFQVRHKNRPTKDMHMPKVFSIPPSSWWESIHDLDLIIGICRHGYQQYQNIWNDPDLCFMKFFQEIAATKKHLIPVANGLTIPTGDIHIAPNHVEGNADLTIKVDDDAMAIDEPHMVKSGDQIEQELVEIENEGFEQEVGDNDDLDEKKLDPDEKHEYVFFFTDDATDLEHPGFHVPTPTELGVRVRRIVSALNKYKYNRQREKDKEEQMIERNRLREERKSERMKSSLELSKKSKQDFQRILLYYGVQKKEDGSGTHDWTQFKVLSELGHKQDALLENYLSKLIQLAQDTVKYSKKVGQEEHTENLVNTSPDYPKGDDGEILNFERARKIVKRIETFYKLRENLKIPEV
jgi:hypothetical protein